MPASQKFTQPHSPIATRFAATIGRCAPATNTGISSTLPIADTSPFPSANRKNVASGLRPLASASAHVHRRCHQKLWTTAIETAIAVATM